jgi:phosphopantetheinyl transferase (holo-ACP synthase)
MPRLAAPRGEPRDLAVRAPASGTRVGCDLVEVERFERVLARNPRGSAMRSSPPPSSRLHLDGGAARRFAVKEATLKALGMAWLPASIPPTSR